MRWGRWVRALWLWGCRMTVQAMPAVLMAISAPPIGWVGSGAGGAHAERGAQEVEGDGAGAQRGRGPFRQRVRAPDCGGQEESADHGEQQGQGGDRAEGGGELQGQDVGVSVEVGGADGRGGESGQGGGHREQDLSRGGQDQAGQGQAGGPGAGHVSAERDAAHHQDGAAHAAGQMLGEVGRAGDETGPAVGVGGRVGLRGPGGVGDQQSIDGQAGRSGRRGSRRWPVTWWS